MKSVAISLYDITTGIIYSCVDCGQCGQYSIDEAEAHATAAKLLPLPLYTIWAGLVAVDGEGVVVECFDNKGLCRLQNCFAADNALRGRNVLPPSLSYPLIQELLKCT